MAREDVDRVRNSLSEFMYAHPEHTIAQAIHAACDSNWLSFEDLGHISTDDITKVSEKHIAQQKDSEIFEIIMAMIDLLFSNKLHYEEGIISLPSFVTRTVNSILSSCDEIKTIKNKGE